MITWEIITYLIYKVKLIINIYLTSTGNRVKSDINQITKNSQHMGLYGKLRNEWKVKYLSLLHFFGCSIQTLCILITHTHTHVRPDNLTMIYIVIFYFYYLMKAEHSDAYSSYDTCSLSICRINVWIYLISEQCHCCSEGFPWISEQMKFHHRHITAQGG